MPSTRRRCGMKCAPTAMIRQPGSSPSATPVPRPSNKCRRILSACTTVKTPPRWRCAKLTPFRFLGSYRLKRRGRFQPSISGRPGARPPTAPATPSPIPATGRMNRWSEMCRQPALCCGAWPRSFCCWRQRAR